MGFQSVGGGFLIKDGSGNTKFDSTLENYLETNYLSGSVSVPRRDCENTSWSGTYTYSLGSCNSSATVVLGAAKIVRADSFVTGFIEISPTDNWNAVGGTLIIGAGRCSYNSSDKVTGDGNELAGAQTLTFYATGGTVYMREKIFAHELPTAAITPVNQGPFLGTPAWTVYYKLSIGLFDR